MKLSIENKIILGFCSLGLLTAAIPQLGYVADIGSTVSSLGSSVSSVVSAITPSRLDQDCVNEAKDTYSKEVIKKLCSTDPFVKAEFVAEIWGGEVIRVDRDLTGFDSYSNYCTIEEGTPLVVITDTHNNRYGSNVDEDCHTRNI